MQPETQYYKAVPVSEKPREAGWYTLTDLKRLDMNRGHYFDGEEWDLYLLNPADKFFTHYLEPTVIPDAAVLRSALEKLLDIKDPGGHPDSNDDNAYYAGAMSILIQLRPIAREALSAGDGRAKETIELMLMRQVEQGNPKDISVFQRNINATKIEGGFDWGSTPEGATKWLEMVDHIRNNNLPVILPSPPQNK